MDIKHIDFITEFKTAEEDRSGAKVFEAYASTFGNIDHHDDVIMKGAFVESLKKRTPKLAYQHDVTKLVGVIKAAEEDDNGLLVRGEFLNTPLGQQVYEEVKAGAITQMSIGFSTSEAEFDDRGVRLIKEIDLYEVSFVTFPANEAAVVTSIKADNIKTIRQFESFLRDAGFSKADATRIASHGYKSSDEIKRDANNSELTQSILQLTNKFKETLNV